MFLAIKEMLHEKGKYSLIITLIVLISFLTFFLTFLANGLATSNRSALEMINNNYKYVVVSKNANDNLMASNIKRSDIKDEDFINVLNKVAYINKKKVNVTVMSSNSKKIIPEVVSGKSKIKANEVIVSESLKNQAKLKLNDEIKLASVDKKVKVVGFCKKSQYQTLDVVYVSDSFLKKADLRYQVNVNGLLTNDKVDTKSLTTLTFTDLINKLPGYTPQVMTFALMIFFLIIIAAVIITIFVYILTIQKLNIFAVLKARGYNNRFINKSIISQMLVISSLGTLLGLLLTYLVSMMLPKTMFFLIDTEMMIGLVIVFIFASLLGSIFSMIKINKVRAVDALR